MATRRRSSASKTAKSAPKSIKESTISVKKVTTPPLNRVNKVTQPKVKKVTETPTETPKVETKNVKSLLHDYPRDGFSLILLPLLLLEAGVKEGLKLAGVLKNITLGIDTSPFFMLKLSLLLCKTNTSNTPKILS